MNLVGKRVEFNTTAFPKTAKYAGMVWLVQRSLQVNIEMQRVTEDGNTFGSRMRAHPSMVRVLDGHAPTVQPVALVHIETGSIVRVNGISKIDPNTLFIVMQDKGFTAKLVKLGGDGGRGRYWPNIPLTALTLVDMKDVLK